MLNTSPNVYLADHFSFIHDAINLQCFLAIMMPPPPPPPSRAQPNGVPLPPPAVTRNRISTPKTSFTSASQPPFPPAYSKPNSREAYGEIQNTSTGIAYRRPSDSRSQEATFAYGIEAPSSYGAPKVHPEIKTSAATNQYQHNSSALLLLTPALASILWYHDSIVIIQIFIFVVLLLYGLDLMNSRDGLAVGIWIAALVLTMASGFGTLLQVDDADADGSNMILFLLRISLEGMLFCSMVRENKLFQTSNYENLCFNVSPSLPALCIYTGLLVPTSISMVTQGNSQCGNQYGKITAFHDPASNVVNSHLSHCQIVDGLLGSRPGRDALPSSLCSPYDDGYGRCWLQP